MQVFNTFFKIMRKNLITIIIWTVIFISISIAASQSSSASDAFKEQTLDICVFDEDNTDLSASLTEFLGSRHNIKTIENDDDKILDALYYENIDYVLTIRKGFAENLRSGRTENILENRYVHSSYSNMLITSLTNQYVSTFEAYEKLGLSSSEAAQKTAEALSLSVPVNRETFSESHIYSDDYSETFSMYFNYLPYILMQIIIATLCPVLLKMNSRGVKARTNCSCIKSSSHTVQLTLAGIVFVTGIWLVFMITGAVLNGEMYSGRALLAVLNSFVFVIICTAISLLISSFNPGAVGINISANIISLGMSFLCGIFVPMSYLSEKLLSAARFLPCYWYIRANEMLSGVSGEAFSENVFMKFIGIELLFAAALFAAAAAVMKFRHDRIR